MILQYNIAGLALAAPSPAVDLEPARHETAFVTIDQQVSAFYVENRLPLYRYLVLAGLPEGEAQDVAQEAFLVLYRTLLTGEVVENWRAWLFRTARNAALNRFKAAGAGLASSDIEAAVAPGGSDPEQQAIEAQRCRRLFEAIDALSPQQRECLHLRAAGHEYKEIAGILGLKTSTVGEFLRRGIAQLRKAGL